MTERWTDPTMDAMFRQELAVTTRDWHAERQWTRRPAARPLAVRLLSVVAATVVTAVVVVGGLLVHGGVGSPRGSALPPATPGVSQANTGVGGSWTTRTANRVSLSVPSEWHVGQPWSSAGSFSYLAGAFSNQALSPPCATGRNSLACGAPLSRLRTGGMLVEVFENGFPGWTLDRQKGTPTMVAGLPARVALEAAGTECAGLGADLASTQVIADGEANYVEIVVCSRGLDAAEQHMVAMRIFASVRIAS